MKKTQGTEERQALMRLVDTRGAGFVIAMLRPAGVSAKEVGAVYLGQPIEDAAFSAIQRVFRERLGA